MTALNPIVHILQLFILSLIHLPQLSQATQKQRNAITVEFGMAFSALSSLEEHLLGFINSCIQEREGDLTLAKLSFSAFIQCGEEEIT